MKKLWLGVIGLAAASTANAAVVTFTLSYNDDGAGGGPGSAPNNFAVYADVTTDAVGGAGANGGLFAFGVDLVSQANAAIVNTADPNYGKANLTFVQMMAPSVIYRKTGSPNKFAGIGAGISEDTTAGKISGLPDLARGTDATGNLIAAYGFGQETGDMTQWKPAVYTSTVDNNTNAPGTAYNAHILLGIGGWDGTPANKPLWQVGSVDNKSSVYLDRVRNLSATPPKTGFESVIQIPELKSVGIPTGRNFVGLANTADTGSPGTQVNVATGQQITVTGSNNRYSSEVDQLTSDNVTAGNAPIVSIGDEPGSVYVMAKLNGAAADVQAFLDAVTADVGPGDSQFALLHANYDSLFGAGGFNALFKFDNFAGPKVFSIETTGTTGVSVDQLAAVPEPATMSLLGLGALGLLARRRRNA